MTGSRAKSASPVCGLGFLSRVCFFEVVYSVSHYTKSNHQPESEDNICTVRYVAACINTFLVMVSYFILWRQYGWLVYPAVIVHLGFFFFPFGTTTNLHVLVFFRTCVQFSWVEFQEWEG
jgi:hypothetical protein